MVSEVSHEPKLAVILHADIVDSTVLVQQNESLTHARICSSSRNACNTGDRNPPDLTINSMLDE
jgi:hypothetical protein